MSKFLLGLLAGHYLGSNSSNKHDTLGISKEQILEHVQAHVLIELVTVADAIEKQNPSEAELKLQMKPLKMIFDRIDLSVIHSSAGRTVYQQVQDYFHENGIS